MSQTMHVEIDDLRVSFLTARRQRANALDGISFSIARGERVGIVGESGCGKSTLARSLLGYLREGAAIETGHVRVNGTDLFALDEAGLRRYRGAAAAMVPQNPLSSLTPHRTIGQHLAEVIGLHTSIRGKEATLHAEELLAAMKLPDPKAMLARYPHEISGGQRQRVVIAAAIVARPGLIVLDEPTTALDKTVETQVLDLVSELQESLATTLVYVSHDLNVIARMCDRVLVIKDGRLLEDGGVSQVFHTPKTEYARNLVDAIPRLEAKPLRLSTGSGAPAMRIDSLTFSYADAQRSIASLWRGQKQAQPTLSGIDVVLPKGRTLGIVGESGSGKSTLARIAAGLIGGYSGRIEILGQTVKPKAADRPVDLKRRVQMIFQDPLSSLNPMHTVAELIGRPLQIYFGLNRPAANERVLQLLEELELPESVMTRLPRQLSGGQQQRVAVARAFACKPDIVLCDEITSALDVTVQASVLKLMKRLQEEHGTSYFFISHDLPIVAEMSDQLMVLERGMIRDLGNTADILAAPKSDYTRKLVAAFTSVSAEIAERKYDPVRSVANHEA